MSVEHLQSPEPDPHGVVATVCARSLKKTYTVGGQTTHALNDVSFDIAPGEYVAIMGSSGSGKSTLMNMIGTLDVPSSGSLSLDGTDLSTMTPNELAHIRNIKVGFVFQQFNLLPGVVALRQVMLPLLYANPQRSDALERARTCLKVVGLADKLDHTPNQLSGGQQQRVAIARAIVNEPHLLLADEPTGALDSNTTREILTLFGELHDAGLTIVLITHEADVAACAKRKIVLRDGKIEQDVRLRNDERQVVT